MARYPRCFRKPVYFLIKKYPGWDYYAIRNGANRVNIFTKSQTSEDSWRWCCALPLSALRQGIDAERYTIVPREMTYG